MMRLLVLAAVLAAAAPSTPAWAQHEAGDTVAYRARQGDTLELIAAEFYGDRRVAKLIAIENHMKKPRPLGAGERLRVPIDRTIVTSRGDTFESLAQTYLGDARRAGFLADFNGMSTDASLPTGTQLSIPFHVQHVATDAESLAKVAEDYYGDARQADLLRQYNNLDKPSLEKGDTILVPVLSVHVRSAKLPPLDADARARRDKQRQVVAEAAAALPRARTAWLEGDFAGVQAALAQLGDETDYLDTPAAVEIGLLLGKAHCAFGETDQAVDRFKQVLDRAPRETMSAYADSPKVIAAWQQAGGRIDGQ
jgi:LysM repeat protein